MPHTGFDSHHSSVVLLYFAAIQGLTTCVRRPVYLLLSFCFASAYGVTLYGGRRLLRSLCIYFPTWVFVVLCNTLWNGLGLTVLFTILERPITVEALVYGATSGLMLVDVLLWMGCMGEVMTSDRVLGLIGRIAPTTALAASMTMRQIPDALRRGEEVAQARKALVGTETGDKRVRRRHAARRLTAVMGWSMEEALETAETMQARGYGAVRRTSYSGERFRKRDAAALFWLTALLVLSVIFLVNGAAEMRFYPRIVWPQASPLPYVLFALLAGYPLFVKGKEWWQWRRFR